jgi:hypothetical protein
MHRRDSKAALEIVLVNLLKRLENLWNRAATICALHHFSAARWVGHDVNFGKAHSFGRQQAFRSMTKATDLSGVEFNSRHRDHPF